WNYSVIRCDAGTGKTLQTVRKIRIDEPRPKAWVGEPSIPCRWDDGKMYTFKRLPKAEEVTAFRITFSGTNRTEKALSAANFAALLDGLKPIKADDEDTKLEAFAPW